VITRFCKRFAFLLLLGLLGTAAPQLAQADKGHAEEAVEAEHSGHGAHGGKLSLKEIATGEHSLEFWGSVVNFSLLVILIVRMGRKPVASFLGKRHEDIERGISEAAAVKSAAEAAFNTYTERMKSLDTELAKLRKDVAEAAERDRTRIVAEANENVARLKAETDSLVQRQAEQLEAQIRREVVQAAAEAAEKAARELSTPEDQQRLAETFLREISKVGEGSKGAPSTKSTLAGQEKRA
jgi:F-type H+-transporting ATPase subunit b